MKRRWPRTKPWGTPWATGAVGDLCCCIVISTGEQELVIFTQLHVLNKILMDLYSPEYFQIMRHALLLKDIGQ